MSLAPGSRLDAYEIVRPLGAGGMGEVWLANELRLGRKVALKLLPADLTRDASRVQRFEQEARAASALSHPNVCHIYALGQTEEGQHYIAMELVEGETLRQRLSTTGPPIREALDIAIQVAAALSAAHAAGIVHRDIKPENVMLRPDGFVKVLDFGLAKLAPTSPNSAGADSTRTALKTDAGTVVGTAAYMSPEQARGQEVDARTDIWSLGVMLYEMVAGRSPFGGPSGTDVLAAILDREPAPLARFEPDTPPELQRIVTKALRKDRNQRYQTIQDLLLDLRALRDEQQRAANTGITPTVNETRSSVSAGALEPQRKRRIAIGVAVLITAGPIAGWWWWNADSTQRQPAVSKVAPRVERQLTRLTFGPGLQTEPTFSPDGTLIAYASDRTGNFDIWVQSVAGGNPVQITHSPAQDIQPDWSPDGKMIAFRSSREGGGLFTVSPLGGIERKLANFGFRPRFSPDSASVLFVDSLTHEGQRVKPDVFLVDSAGGTPRKIFGAFWSTLPWVQALDWHPDGRISVVGASDQPFFLTASPNQREPLRSVINRDVLDQLKLCGSIPELRWGASAQHVVLVCASDRGRNILSIRVDPGTLTWTGPVQHLTLGAESHPRLAISRRGGLLAFSTEITVTRIWAYRIDDATGRLTGEGRPITPPDFSLAGADLSPDGRTLVYSGAPTGSGRGEVWEVSLETGSARLRVSDKRPRYNVRSSRANIAYTRYDEGTFRVAFLRPNDSSEYVLAESNTLAMPFDTSPNGAELVGTGFENGSFAIVAWPLNAAPHGERHRRTILRDPGFSLWNSRYSPDGRWLCFNANGPPVSIIGVVSADGDVTRPWRRVTSDTEWSDQPRWSPTGSLLFYVTGFRELAPNVWAVPFDRQSGRPAGRAVQVTRFDNPARGFPQEIDLGPFGVGKGRLAVPVAEVSGSIWTLDNADE